MVLDIRISRLVQMIHTIQASMLSQIQVRRVEVTWQTRNICAFIASTVEDNDARNKLFAQAQRLTLLEDEVDDTTTDERSLEDVIENGSIESALARNNARKGPGLEAMRFSQG